MPVKWVATSAHCISCKGERSWATALCASKGDTRTWWGVQPFRGGFLESIPPGATFLTVFRVLLCQWEWIKSLCCLLLPLHLCLQLPIPVGSSGAGLGSLGEHRGNHCHQPPTGKDLGLSQAVAMGCRAGSAWLRHNQPAGFCCCRHLQTSCFHPHRLLCARGGSPEGQRMAVGLPGWLLKASEVAACLYRCSGSPWGFGSHSLCHSLTETDSSGLCSLSKVPAQQEQQDSQAKQKKEKTCSALDHAPVPDLESSPCLLSMRQDPSSRSKTISSGYNLAHFQQNLHWEIQNPKPLSPKFLTLRSDALWASLQQQLSFLPVSPKCLLWSCTTSYMTIPAWGCHPAAWWCIRRWPRGLCCSSGWSLTISICFMLCMLCCLGKIPLPILVLTLRQGLDSKKFAGSWELSAVVILSLFKL